MLEDDVAAALPGIRGQRIGLGEWIRSVRGVRELQWFAPDDPTPLFMWLAVGIRTRARTRFRKRPKATRHAPAGIAGTVDLP